MKFNVSTFIAAFLIVILGLGVTACSGAPVGAGDYQSRYFNRGSFGQVTPCGHQACSIDY